MIPQNVIYGYITYSFFQLIGLIYGAHNTSQALIMLFLGLFASLIPGALYVSSRKRADHRYTATISDWTPSLLIFALILISFSLGVYAS